MIDSDRRKITWNAAQSNRFNLVDSVSSTRLTRGETGHAFIQTGQGLLRSSFSSGLMTVASISTQELNANHSVVVSCRRIGETSLTFGLVGNASIAIWNCNGSQAKMSDIVGLRPESKITLSRLKPCQPPPSFGNCRWSSLALR
jgi:hypothetical protein